MKILTSVRSFVLTSFFIFFHCVPLQSAPSALAAPSSAPVAHRTESIQREEPVQARLIAEQQQIQPGHSFWVGVELKMAKGWDTYWLNPGDSGFATQVTWTLPEGFTVGPLLWPYPERFTADSLVAFGYTDSVLLMAEVTPTPQLVSGQNIEIQAEVNWLACNESCVPGHALLSLGLPISDQMNPEETAEKILFVEARKGLPQRQENLIVKTQADQIIFQFKPLEANLGKVEEALFIPEENEVIDYLAPQKLDAENGRFTLSVKRAHPEGSLNALKGVLLVSDHEKTFQKAILVDNTLSPSKKGAVDGVSTLGIALLFAFVGGLILNVMPCVLPVVALKIFGFVKLAQEKRKVIFLHGGVFSLGVLLSFWILLTALLVLRAYGEGIGWGFQLQEPIFVAVLASILFMLGLSLFGLFELGTSLISLGNKSSSSGSPLASSFMSGVLATLVATPCTGPLLGPALGFAMTLPVIQTLAIFTAMGLGMAFPYLLFSAFPKLVHYLPKPGHWMTYFKQIMGFLMMGTVVWLIWIFGAQTDNLATFVLMGALLLMAIGGWIFGTWGTFSRPKATRWIATALATCIVLIGGTSAVQIAKQHHFSERGNSELAQEVGWEAYSPERVAELQAQGTPIFVDFTAKWCLICQANKVTLHSSEVQKSFREKGVVLMIADWTKKDRVITEELEKLGRTGVPLYVLYPGKSQQPPYILPQTLTSKVIQEYLSQINSATVLHVD